MLGTVPVMANSFPSAAVSISMVLSVWLKGGQQGEDATFVSHCEHSSGSILEVGGDISLIYTDTSHIRRRERKR